MSYASCSGAAGLSPLELPPLFGLLHAEQILLRKVGGGYIFLHRLLLDYFADLETSSDSKVLAEDRQEILSLESVSSTSAEPSEADSYMDAPTAQLISTSILSEVPRRLSCGHEQPTPNARFCSVCGEPVQSIFPRVRATELAFVFNVYKVGC